MIESFRERKDRLKGEGKIELPLNIDSKKYLIGKISFWDLLIVSPALLISIVSMVIFYSQESLTKDTALISLTPTIVLTAFQLIKHPIRSNISFLQYRLIWKIKYQRRHKEFFYKKGEINMQQNDQDIRKELGIRDVFSSCYETNDNRFVKVIDVSAVNLSLMSSNERQKIFTAYKTFINELQFVNEIQISQVAQPVNLSKHLLHVDNLTHGEKNPAKRMLIKSYKEYVEGIQKTRDMVARKRYVIIDQPIGSDREKSLNDIERKASLVTANLENMLTGHARLIAKPLNNEELLQLIYTCLDYDNAQSVGEFIIGRAHNSLDISLGSESAQKLINQLQKQVNENIN
ncbi:hypothetical protein [Bacillus paranthracis]|uniref:hypothetical protein n=1 Tax=Bacillus paranthracis TaxID=2026186 RepID=UPI000A302855|nr:hypothetical protein [Bacillus paranthracis]MCU5288467.1 hypothetical protein [Bacillus paranthracis]SME52495.1 hypothetical protein BACERE00176_05514 [Bacillus paranthracis]